MISIPDPRPLYKKLSLDKKKDLLEILQSNVALLEELIKQQEDSSNA